ncbi:hypothetical protein T07_10199 [Trichinella nelsoni]|uniref:Uncharacterized protein n=1 Tax=Trichinella nelsoni TaxID=6336 RepID=A0A0V0RZA7_9BILA|nr:hypothetical protein T07_10199 [Trichinella nelsoni]
MAAAAVFQRSPVFPVLLEILSQALNTVPSQNDSDADSFCHNPSRHPNSFYQKVMSHKIIDHFNFIRLFSSLQCYQSGTWSTIILLFNSTHE